MNYPKIKNIKKLTLDEENYSKGSNFIINLENIDINELPVFYRKKGVVSSGHFHKGESRSRDPEILYILKGKVKMIFEDLYGDKIEMIFSRGEGFTCPPWIYQSYEILEESIFIEPRIDKYEEIPDTYTRKEFDKIKSTSKDL